jgi:peptidoglycan/xylan/chitin deacetylase (PgdA/CDA1 family)
MMRVRQFTPIPTVTIITYHHIADRDPAYLYDPDVSDATPAQFRWQMETVARYCTPIGIDELIGALEGGPLPKNPVMVTFDDGYRSCSDTALPILRAVGVRATFFIATSYVSERKLYWWEKNALLLNKATRTGRLTYPTEILIDPRDLHARKILNDTIKNTPNLDVEKFQAGIAAALGVEWSDAIEAEYANGLMMTWDQIRALSRAGMDVESHSRSHRVLQTLDDENLRSELTGSREDLEAQLGRPVRAIAYPVGRRIQREVKIRRALDEAGYRIGLSNMSGVNRMWPVSMRAVRHMDPFDMRRLATDRGMSDAMYFAQVAVPQLAYVNYYNR